MLAGLVLPMMNLLTTKDFVIVMMTGDDVTTKDPLRKVKVFYPSFSDSNSWLLIFPILSLTSRDSFLNFMLLMMLLGIKVLCCRCELTILKHHKLQN